MKSSYVALARKGLAGSLAAAGLLSTLFLFPVWGLGFGVSQDVMKVEEDWELVVLEPDRDNNAPQVTCMTSPSANSDGVFAAVEINHGTLPDYSAGGLQLQVWNGEDALALRDFSGAALDNSGETISWTQRMSLKAGKLSFQVVNGQSATWGAFGGSGNLKLTIGSALTDLSGYSPETSKANSGVGFSKQRVQMLRMVRVRCYNSTGDMIAEDSSPRVVYQQ